METLQDGDYKTEFGQEGASYRFRQSVRGSVMVDILATDKESAIHAAQIFLLHELVRRQDIREFGHHDDCEGCQFEAKLDRQEEAIP